MLPPAMSDNVPEINEAKQEKEGNEIDSGENGNPLKKEMLGL